MIKKIIIILGAFLFLTACSPIAVPPESTYAITSLKNQTLPVRAKTKLSLLVTVPSANPGYQTNDMVYMLSPYRLQSYADHSWVAPPTQMLMPIFVDAIRQAGYFANVVMAPFSGVTNYRLDTRLIKLQQEFMTPTSQVQLVVEATLINNTSNVVVATRRFSAAIPAPDNNPYSGVLAANIAAANVSQQIAAFCTAAL